MPREKPIPPEAPPVDPLKTLIQKFRYLEAIPEDELKSLGYIRKKIGDAVTIVKEEKWLKQQAEREKIEKKKQENIPFGLIKTELGDKKTQIMEITSPEIIAELKDSVEKIGGTFPEDVIPSNSAFFVFQKDFNEFFDNFSSSAYFEEKDKDFIEREIFEAGYHPWNQFCEEFCKFSIYNYLDWKKNEDILPAAKASLLSEELERMEARLTDIPAIKKAVNQELKSGITSVEEEFLPSSQFLDYCKKNKLNTTEKVGIHFLKEYVKEKGFSEISERIDATQNFDETKKILQEITAQQLPSFQKLKEVKNLLQTASIEEKKNYSGQKKEIEQQQHNEKKIIQGTIEFLSPETFIANFFKKGIKEIKNHLKFQKDEGKIVLFLDGRPHTAYDKDPGEISGDCTKGKPLPFDRPEILAYNVKVFNEQKRHLGNIYLLVTETLKKQKVWHLDAVQIPLRALSDVNTISNLIRYISQEAQNKGIEYITVNNELAHISNYDYIEKAICQYYKQKQLGRCQIKIPDNPVHDYYSSFQGDGFTKILWKKETA